MRDAVTSKKTTPEAETKAGLRWIAQNDLYALARRILYRDAKTPMSETFHRPVCRFRQTSPFSRNLYLLSRDHLKTSLLTCAGNVQRILRNQQIRILLAGNKADSAETQLSEIKGHLQNPLLVWLFPEILFEDPNRDAENWSTSKITVKRKFRSKEATIETIGAEGAITGRHFEHGQYDDLVDEHNSATRDQIHKIIHWYKTTQSLFEPGATQEIVGTPWEFGDLYDWLIEQKLKREFSLGVYRQPCWKVREPGVLRIGERGGIAEDDYVLDASGQKISAYPEKHSRASLEERERVDPRIFAAQWLLRPVDDASALFPRSKAIVRSRDYIPKPESLWSVMCVDPASSTKAWADSTAIATVGWDATGLAYLLDIRQGQWPEDEVIDQMYAAFEKTPGIRTIGFEAVGFQKLYMNLLASAGETRGYLPLVKLERDTTVGKTTRIRILQPPWTNGGLVIAADCPALEDFLDQAERFRPWKKDQPDDMLDAVADCFQLRVKPEAENREEGLDDEDVDRRRFEQATLDRRRIAGQPDLDRMSMREAYAQHRMARAIEEQRERETFGAGELNEFYAG